MKITIVVEGGVGQNFIGTATTRLLREKYPESKIYVVAAWPDVFRENPHINGCIQLGNELAYENYVKDCDLFFHKNVYIEAAGGFKREHIVSRFSSLHGLVYDGNGLTYQMTQEEEDKAKRFIDSFKIKKPIILFQPYSLKDSEKNWTPEKAQELIDMSVNKYQWVYVHTDAVFAPYNCFNLINIGVRDIAPLVKYSSSFVSVDSCVQHIAGGLFKKRGVMLIGRSPKELFAWDTTRTVSAPGACEDFACFLPGPLNVSKCLHVSCMRAIEPSQVLEALTRCLE